MTVEAHKETMEFQTEVRQLLQLMINSLYSNKEIFLRELVSNGSDACDKLRFESLSDDALMEDDSEMAITVEFDKDARTITIADNGIGMNRQEVIDNIGTIAKSGTKQFFEALSGDQASDANLIGQFGVGFYSSFIIADKVVVETRRAGTTAEHGVRWESAGEGDFSLETIDKESRGTTITLHVREDSDEFLDGHRLRHIIRTYSDHISLPIKMWSEPMPSMDEDGKEKDIPAPELEMVNSASALWARSKSDISDEEYNEFYKHVGHDFQDPLCHVHSRVEGSIEYTSLLYVPSKAPFDLWDRNSKHGIKLYVRRVFIMDDAEQLMPQYLRFVRGVVDSADLPLNVSREILQHNKAIDSMRSGSVKKVLGMLEGIAKNDPEQYATFWNEFGRVMKEGPAEDAGNKEKIAKLLRFATSKTDDEAQTVSLQEYVERMPEGQEKIFFITADSFSAAKNSPHLEVFRNKGIEVLLLAERVDEWLVSSLTEFDGKSLQSVAKGDLDLGDLEDKEEKEQQKVAEEENKDFIGRIKEALGDSVKEVRVTHRLTSTPACLVSDNSDMSGNLERILREAGQEMPNMQPILEINPSHALVELLKDESDTEQFSDWSKILFDQALLSEGGQLEDPAGFVARLNAMLLKLAK
ncbi:MAG: molecular chaperone HtpG [Sulfuriflexus sp.]|nr:molecular chaperone HtpG [Sulfuriflexus sp.]